MYSPTTTASTGEERLVFWSWSGAWVAYSVGGLYVIGPALGIILGSIYAVRAYCAPALSENFRPQPIPVAVQLWVAAMGVMLVALVIGHFSQGLSGEQLIKSAVGWAKGWFLLALFPLAGACLKIRLETLCNANGWFALQILIITPILLAAPYIGLPERLFVSPLKILGGAGPEYFTFFLYALDPENGNTRLQYIAPWAPAAGVVASIMLIIAFEDRRVFWRVLGVIASITVVILCRSRMALLSAILAWPLSFMISQLSRGWPVLLTSAVALPVGLLSSQVLDSVAVFFDRVNQMRAGSTRVREALNEMALDRWWTEARVWGHGIVENGPHHVEYMPIGSHHTWFGVLFVKGSVGFIALAIAMIWTTLELAIAAQRRPEARGALAVMIVMWLFSFSENLEMLAYLYWPGLILLGIGLRASSEETRHVFPLAKTVL